MAMCVQFSVFSQIKTTSLKTTENAPMGETPYDSLSNFLGKDYYQYVGQTLYLPKERSKENFGYDHFNKKDVSGSYYKQRSRHYDTKYDAVAGKYFDVIEIVQSKHKTIFLKIKEQKSGDIIYFEYNQTDERFFPFITVGYFEQQKKMLLGKIYPFSKYNLLFSKVTDINNNPFKINYSVSNNTSKDENYYDEWKCIDY